MLQKQTLVNSLKKPSTPFWNRRVLVFGKEDNKWTITKLGWKFVKEDLWIGIFYKETEYKNVHSAQTNEFDSKKWDFYLCPLPCIVYRLIVQRVYRVGLPAWPPPKEDPRN